MSEKTPEELQAEIVELTNQLEAAEDVLRSLAFTLGAGGHNAISVDPAMFLDKISWGIDHLVSGQKNMYEKREKRLLDQLQASRNETARARKEIERLNTVATRRKSELDACYWVWCSGGCTSGMARYPTEEVVQLAELNTKRLRTTFENHKFREAEHVRRLEEKNGGS